jgi:hypothetical protein
MGLPAAVHFLFAHEASADVRNAVLELALGFVRHFDGATTTNIIDMVRFCIK